MKERDYNYDMPAVAPALQEYEWRQPAHDMDDAIIMSIDTDRLPPRYPPSDTPRRDN